MDQSILSWPVVQTGHQQHPVQTLQHLLRAHDYEATVDGIFGARTEAAVQAFQES